MKRLTLSMPDQTYRARLHPNHPTQSPPPGKRLRCLATGFAPLIALLFASTIFASTIWASTIWAQETTSQPPRQWAVEIAAKEILMLGHSDTYLRYRMHIVDQKGDQVRDIIETKDGTVARLILRDGRPLTSDEDTAEHRRLADILASPANYARHVKNDASGKKIATELIHMMPDAMIYTYAPGQPQFSQRQNDVVLDYAPNPKWSPPSTTAEALTGIEGRIWIAPKSRQLVRMEGHIFKPVNFGWGMLAHIYPGGKVMLEQANAGNDRWIYTHFTQQVNVRALMLKSISVNTQIDASSFQVLPGPLSYQDAIRQLLATPLPTH